MDTGVAELITACEAAENITIHLNATLTKTAGALGRFEADISVESGTTVTARFGAIVQASGYDDFDANKLPGLGYGKTPDVVTQQELEALAKATSGGPIKRPSDGKEVKSVAFIQCAGQRSNPKRACCLIARATVPIPLTGQ